jgi:hypothetical protein
MSDSRAKPRLPPRWFIRLFSPPSVPADRRSVGLWQPKPNRGGAMRLNTVGRRTE